MSEISAFLFLGVWLWWSIQIARCARQRGYSRWYWFVATCCLNSSAVLALLGAIPNRAQDDRRKLAADWLAQRLRTALPIVAIPSVPHPSEGTTIGDHDTA